MRFETMLIVFLSLVLALSAVVPTRIAGSDLMWEYDNKTQTLTISGNGDMPDYDEGEADMPWREYLFTAKEVVIKPGVTSIGANAFTTAAYLEKVTIPDTVKKIGDSAFSCCVTLSDLTIGNGVEEIGEKAFENCLSLSDPELPDSLKKIGEWAFTVCGLTDLVIPDSVEEIADSAFWYCGSLVSLTIGKNVKTIGEHVFTYCYKLIEVCNRSSLEIEDYLFSSESLAIYNIYTPTKGKSYLKTVGDGFVFYEDGDEVYLVDYRGTEADITLPSIGKPYTIRQWAFAANEDIAFLGVTAEKPYLKSVVIPDDVTGIESKAFVCPALYSITVGKNVKRIGADAFDCRKLVEVYDKSSMKIKDDQRYFYCEEEEDGFYEHNPDFYGIEALNVYTPTEGKSKLKTVGDGFVFYEDGDEVYLVAYKGTKTKLTLPDIGKKYEIYDWAFPFENFVSVTIPDSVTKIGEAAFMYCRSLTNVKIPDSVTEIGEAAFAYCRSLTNVKIPDSVTEIGEGAFGLCGSLKRVEIGKNVEELDETFSYCLSLETVLVNAVTPPELYDEYTFEYEDIVGTLMKKEPLQTRSLKAIYVPDASVDAYKAADGWSEYADIIFPMSKAPKNAPGDLTGDGNINALDYTLAKAIVLKTIVPTEEQKAAMDVNHDGNLNALDCMLIKAHILKTYVIQ